jgi:hypothetical protein
MARVLGDGEAKAGGKTWHLRFDMNVLADLQEETGKNPVQIMSELQDDGGSVVLARVVCHAMLKRFHPEATLQDAGDILSEDMDAMMTTITAAMPAPTQGDLGNGRVAGLKA